MLLAAIYGLGDDEYKGLWLVQILCDSASALLIFLIGLELLNWWVGLIAAIMVALTVVAAPFGPVSVAGSPTV